MPELSLREQRVVQTERIRRQLARLDAGDPAKAWFAVELETLTADRAGAAPLHEDNARIRALRQLHYLLSDRLARSSLPDGAASPEPAEESIMTAVARLPSQILEMVRRHRFSIEPALLFAFNQENEQFDQISPTAKAVAYLRGLDESLKFASELNMAAEGERLLEELGIRRAETRDQMALLFQSRHHALNAAIAARTCSQIVELGAGISPRGLQWARSTPDTIYIESDLPQLMIRKAKLLRNCIVADSAEPLGVLHCCGADVLDFDSIVELLHSLDASRPFTLVTEGLSLYFSETEMRTYWENLRRLLVEYPQAVWATDLVTQQNLQELLASDPDVAQAVRRIFELTGRKVIAKNPFASDACVERWLHDHGLQVESTIPLQATAALTNAAANVTETQRERIVGSRKIWRITARRPTAR